MQTSKLKFHYIYNVPTVFTLNISLIDKVTSLIDRKPLLKCKAFKTRKNKSSSPIQQNEDKSVFASSYCFGPVAEQVDTGD